MKGHIKIGDKTITGNFEFTQRKEKSLPNTVDHKNIVNTQQVRAALEELGRRMAWAVELWERNKDD